MQQLGESAISSSGAVGFNRPVYCARCGDPMLPVIHRREGGLLLRECPTCAYSVPYSSALDALPTPRMAPARPCLKRDLGPALALCLIAYGGLAVVVAVFGRVAWGVLTGGPK